MQFSNSSADVFFISLMELNVFRESDKAVLPHRATDESIGYDLSSIHSFIVPAHGSCHINTGVCVQIPEGHYGRIASRSGLAFHHSIMVGAGVIDRDYVSTVIVLLHNHSSVHYHGSAGDRVAQLIIECATCPRVNEVHVWPPFSKSHTGFGSTGI